MLLSFSEPVFKQRYFPYLAVAFFLSFIFDAVFLWKVVITPPETLQSAATRSMWLQAWIFLLIANEGLLKGVSWSWYRRKRSRLQRSSVIIQKSEIVFSRFDTLLTRRQLRRMEGVVALENNDKTEFLQTTTFHVRKVTSWQKHANGDLLIHGEIKADIQNDLRAVTSWFDADTNDHFITDECVIPSVFENMAAIEAKLIDSVSS